MQKQIHTLNGGVLKRLRRINDLDRWVAARTLARWSDALANGGEEALQRELDKAFPGTNASPRPPEFIRRRG